MMVLALIIAAALALFYITLQFSIPGMWKFLLVVLEMTLAGQLLIKLYKLPSEIGMVLVKSKGGIEAIDALAKGEKAFNFLADAGSAACYGLLSLVLMRKTGSPATLALGLLVLAFASFIVAPSAFVFLFQVLKIGQVDKSMGTLASSGDIGLIAVAGTLLVGGLFLFMLAGIVLYGTVVLAALANTLFFGADTISRTSAGGTFLLPGINLPFFEGILALLVVLIVHEGAHAILTRIARVPLLSSGVAFFGIIPIGAFVEPDEKKLAAVPAPAQTRVLVAGAAANLMACCAFFVLFVAAVFAINGLGLASGPLAPAARFIYTFLGLAFSLNFVVAAVNLLPVPLFDGYRIMDVNVKNKTVVKALMATALVFFLLNFLPMLFHA